MIPTVLSHPTVFQAICLILTWAGGMLLASAILPKPVYFPNASVSSNTIRLLALGALGMVGFLIYALLFRSGKHGLKIVGAVFLLLSVAIACIGAAAIVQALASWLTSKPVFRRLRSGLLPTVLISVLFGLPFIIPVFGKYIYLPVMLLISSGAGLKALLAIKHRRTVATGAVITYSPFVRIAFAVVGLLFVGSIVPVAQVIGFVKYTATINTTDGNFLAMDVYLPSYSGKYPIIIIRTPNGRDRSDINPERFLRNGYGVLIQDTRGRGSSTGVGMPFNSDLNERPNDGWDTIKYLVSQPWCNGAIGLLGTVGNFEESYNQLTTDGAITNRITSQLMVGAPPSLYHYMAFPGGIFRKKLVESWLEQNHYKPEALAEWVTHYKYDDFWLARDFDDRWQNVDWPTMHVGGWFDPFSQGTLDTFNGFQTKGSTGARDRQRLVMGPWTYGNNWRKSAGDLTYPNGDGPEENLQDPIKWFDFSMRGALNGIEKLPALYYYVMGDTEVAGAPGNSWRTATSWPPDNTTDTNYYLHASKQLSPSVGAKDAALTYTFDPKNPVPTVGGPNMYLPSGPIDQRKNTERPDVLSFVSEPLSQPTEVTGRVKAKLFVSSDAVDTDFFVKLCDVYPDGKVMNICEGQLRTRFRNGFLDEDMMVPGTIYPLEIDLWSTSIIFNKGHKIEVIVTSSNSPAYDVNPNTGDPFRANSKTQIAHNNIYIDAAHPSRIILPIAP